MTLTDSMAYGSAEETERKRAEGTIRALNETLESRLLALTQPVGDVSSIQLKDLFNIEELQKVQDAFALATGVASIITDTQGQPITRPSNFCRLCEHIIRKTEEGLLNCYRSDASLGRMHPEGPILQRCLSGGLWDAGTSICVGDRHIANWLIGQVLEEPVDEEKMMAYAREIGVDEEEFRKALAQVTRMPLDQFKEVAGALYLIADQLSKLAIQNVQQARFITERKKTEEALQRLNRELRAISTCGEVLVRATDEQALLDEICRIICDEAGYRMAWVGYAEHDEEKTVRPVAWAGVDDGYVAEARISWADTERGRGPIGTAVRTGQTACVQDFTTDPEAAPWREAAAQRGSRSGVALPLKDGRDATFGTLTIYSTEPGAFTPDEIRLLGELATDLAFGITVLRTRAERDEVDDALRASEEQYRRFVEDDVAGVYITTPDGRVLTCNPAFARMLGFASVAEGVATNVVTIYQESAAREALLADLRAQGRVDGRELAWRRVDGAPVAAVVTAIGDFDEGGQLAAIRGYVIDITERKRLEEQLRQSQKMEAIGRLAGGVAHDFNNLLTAINGYADILVAGMAPDEPQRADVEEIRKAGDRAAALTRQLLAFSRRQVLKPVVLDLDVVVAGIAPMLRRLVGEQIEFRVLAPPDLNRVRADPAQVEQVLLNLVVNARDAMPGGGTLTIEMANVELDDDYVRTHPHVAPGPYVQLAVSDTGVGMDAATMAHLFEPFFTTKPAGEGTGLGLATAYGIVTQSGGHIAAYSEPGQGSTFRVYLPRVTAAVEPVLAAAAGPAPGGSEAVLVVEDEDVVRSYAERVLKGLGYDVSAARSGVEALALVADHPEPFDLLVTDVMLPGMNGRELSDQLTARKPSLRTLFVSGYTQDAIVHRGALDAGVAFLGKPFTPHALGHAVRDVLDASRQAAVGERVP